MENNDFQSALDFTNEALETITDDLTSAVDKEIHEVEDLIRTAAELGADTTKATTLIERARGDIGNLDFEKAKNAVRQSRAESEKALQRSLDGKAGDFSKFTQEARAIGADPSAAQESFDRAEAEIKKGNYRDGAALAKQGFQAIQQAQFRRVIAVIGASREKFMAAANMDIDLKGPMEDLNNAREAVKRGAFREAIDSAKRADTGVDQILESYRKVEGRLKEVHRSFAEAEAFGVQTTRARKLAETARQAYQDRNLVDVEQAVDGAMDELRKTERERVMQSLERGEFVLTLAEQNGVDVSGPSKLLQDAIVATKANEHRKALRLAADVETETERLLADHATARVAIPRSSVPHLGDDGSSLKALVNRADASSGSRDFEGAFKAIGEGEKFIEGRIRTNAEEIVGDLAVAVRMGVDLGANVASLEIVHRELNGFLAGGRAGEIITAREKATGALAGCVEELSGLVRGRIATAQGLKIDVDAMSDLVRRARLAFGVQNYHEGLRLLNEGNDRASKATALHRQAFNAIASAAAFVAEAKKRNVDVSKVVEMLVDAKKAFERLDYERALQLASVARAETDKLTVLYSSAQKILSSRGRLELAAKVGIDAPHLREVFGDAKEAMKGKDYEKALALAQRTEDEFTALIQEKLTSSLASAERILGSVDGVNLAQSSDAIIRARQHLAAGELDRAADLTIKLREQLDLLKRQGDEATTALRRLKEIVADAERVGLQQAMARQAVETVERKLRSMGNGSTEVTRLVSDARKMFDEADFVRALDTAVRASDAIADLRILLEETREVRDRAQKLLQTAYEVRADAAKFEKFFQEGETALEAGEVGRARSAFAGSLDCGLGVLRSRLQEELAQGETLVATCRQMDVDPTPLLNRFSEARAQVEAENFPEAWASIRDGRDSAENALGAKLNRAIQEAAANVAHAKKLGSDARDAEALLRQANEQMQQGEFEKAVSVVEGALERVESAKVVEKRFIDLTFKVETTIRNGRKFGIDMKAAEGKLGQAMQLRKSDFPEAIKAAEEAYRTAWEANEAFAPSMRAYIDVGPTRVNEWADATLTIENIGKGLAKDVRVRIVGDAETEGLTDVAVVPANGSEAVKLRLKMTASGAVPLAIQVISHPAFDRQEYTQEMIAPVDASELV